MTDKDRVELKKKIIAEITKSEKDIIEIEKLTQPITPENSIGRVSRMDAINNKSVMEAALRTKKSKLTKLRVALIKVDEKDFGLCAFCKRPIQALRLMYMPESTRCVRCASR
ncbi:MAG: TraR/DksA C4-type zinc finger protein [Saprospiraceae bacterium]|nr:TraR/DksA C4-type zinc finger protein [Saprospiraceae bacterium]